MRIRTRSKKNLKPKQQAKQKTPQPPPKSKVIIPRSMVEQVCSLTDPFCNAAHGAKYPDSSSVRTLPWTKHGRITLDSTSNGSTLNLWHPQYSFEPFIQPTTRTGSIASGWVNPFPTATSLPTGTLKYRIISSGFVMRNICAKLTSSGMVHLRSWSVPEGASYVTVDGLAYNSSVSMDISCNDVKELCVVTQRSPRMPQEFFPVSGDQGLVANFIDNGFVPVTIYVDGAPASTDMFDVEYYINFELVFDDSASLGLIATPSNQSSAIITSAAAKLTSSASSVFSKALSSVSSKFIGAAENALLSYIAGPLAPKARSAVRAITLD